MTLLLVLALIGFLLSFFFSGFETGSYALGPIRFQLRKAEGRSGARILARHLKDMPRVIATALIGTNAGNYLLTASVVAMFYRWDPRRAELLSTLILTPLVFMLAEVLPKELFRRHADTLVYRSARLFDLSALLFRPVTLVLGLIPQLLRALRLVPLPRTQGTSVLERFTIELTRGTELGTVTRDQAAMAQRIITLRQKTVRDALVPLWKVVKMDVKTDMDAARKRITEHAFSRVPVYGRNPAELIGSVWIYDVLFGHHPSLEGIVESCQRLPESTPIDAALLRLRNQHKSMAFVVDKRDRILGIVTLKDLAAQIVADLHDL